MSYKLYHYNNQTKNLNYYYATLKSSNNNITNMIFQTEFRLAQTAVGRIFPRYFQTSFPQEKMFFYTEQIRIGDDFFFLQIKYKQSFLKTGTFKYFQKRQVITKV